MGSFNLENYETVEDRLARFWQDHPDGRVLTSIHYYDENRILVRSEVYFDRKDDRPISTGYAEEIRGASPVNRTSHCENAETSAIGRALANCGYAAKGARPSREEMAKVVRLTTPPPAVDAKFREACVKANIKPEDVAQRAEVDLNSVSDADLPRLRDAFKELTKPLDEFQKLTKPLLEKATTSQVTKVRAMLSSVNTAKEMQTEVVSDILNRRIYKLAEISKDDANFVIQVLQGRLDENRSNEG